MFAGYEALEEYEDELYREAEDSSESGRDSEVEFQLYSQVHYSMKLDEPGSSEREKERNQPSAATLLAKRNDIIVNSDSEPILISDAAEFVIVSDETDLDSVCSIKGKKGPISKTAKRRLLDGQTLLESNSFNERTPSSKPFRLRDAITMSTGLNSFQVVIVEKSRKSQDGETSDSDFSDRVECWVIQGRANQDGDNTILLNLDGSTASENEAGPEYLLNLLTRYVPARKLRSSDSGLLVIPKQKCSTLGERSFSVMAPTLWNPFPALARDAPTVACFKSTLKTHLLAAVLLLLFHVLCYYHVLCTSHCI